MAQPLDPAARASVNVSLDPNLLTRLAARIGASQTLTNYVEIDFASHDLTAVELSPGGTSDLAREMRRAHAEGAFAAHDHHLHPKVSTLISLKMRGNPLGDEGLRVVATALTTCPGLALHSLNLASTAATYRGVSAVCDALLYGATVPSGGVSAIPLSKMDLSVNSIDMTAASGIAALLRSPHTRLCDLCLSMNALGDAGVTVLANGLAANSSLQRLDLSGNLVGTAGAYALARALTSQRALTTLSLADNALVGEEGGKAARQIIASGVSLRSLWLGGNHFKGQDAVRNLCTIRDVLLGDPQAFARDGKLHQASPALQGLGEHSSLPAPMNHPTSIHSSPKTRLMAPNEGGSLDTHLTNLWLERTGIGGGPVVGKLLSAFGKYLEHLWLGNNGLDDIAAQAMASAMEEGHAPLLRKLWLEHNRISARGALALLNQCSDDLFQLRLVGNPIDNEQRAELHHISQTRMRERLGAMAGGVAANKAGANSGSTINGISVQLPIFELEV